MACRSPFHGSPLFGWPDSWAGSPSLGRFLSADPTIQFPDSTQGLNRYSYVNNDNLLSLTDPRNNTTRYTYDDKERPVTRTDPLLKVERYDEYDDLDNLLSMTDRKGQVTTSSYDPLNRPRQLTFADGSTITYSYDAGDRLRRIIDSLAGTITREYDGHDRLLSETTPQGTVSYTYDAASRRSSMTVSGQPLITYTYDNADRLKTITQATALVKFTYDAASRRTQLTLPNGVIVSYTYDGASQLTGLIYKKGTVTLGNLTYTYDKVGQRIKIGGSFARTGLPAAVTANYDSANRLTLWGSSSLSYDANGNLINDGVKTYTWDARDQLTSMTGTPARFQYDATGRRSAKTVGGTSTGFVYDGPNSVQELAGSTPTANLLTGLGIDEVFSRSDAAGTRTLLVDALGSTLALADAAGALPTQYTYEAYGKTTQTGTASTNAFQYTGRENDNTGLYYYRARYYHPVLQRFISEDPIGFAGGINQYTYVGNNPVNLIDPTGEIGLPAIAIGIGAGVTGFTLFAIADCAQKCQDNLPGCDSADGPERDRKVLQCKIQCVKSFGGFFDPNLSTDNVPPTGRDQPLIPRPIRAR